MFKRIQKIAFSVLLCAILLASMSVQALAQTAAPSGVISLADLGVTEIRMIGPFDTNTLTFGLPATWKPNSPAQISLNLTVAFDTVAQADQILNGGTLTVSFNRRTVTALSLDKTNVNDFTIDVPLDYLTSARTDGRMELRFELNSGISCIANDHMAVVINSSSRIAFNYDEVLPNVSLSQFPRPIYQNSIVPDSAYIVIPNQPSSAELQSAYTVAAGIGNLTSSSVALSLVRADNLTAELKAKSNLIFVGKAAAFSQLSELALPLTAAGGKFALTDESRGVVEMVNSPWSKPSVALIVSGNTDEGVIKAAQALSTGSFVAGAASNLAVIETVQNTAPVTPLISDQSLGDMGYKATELNNRGINSDAVNFFVPAGSTVSSAASFDLAYGHSALLNYNLSGMVVLLNGKPIGSVQLTADTSKQAINHAAITIPASLVLPGRNSLEIRVNLEPMDNCVDPNLRGLWAIVWPESRLYLPFVPTSANVSVAMDLALYPAPMVFDPTLTTTALILSRDSVESQAQGLQIASYLGDRSNGAISQLRVFYDDEVAAADLSPYNVIVIGRPSQLKVMDTLGSALPVPFEKGSDIASNKYSQIVYEIPVDAPIGYVQFFPSPWNKEKIVIAALGNTAQGVTWAASALYDAILRPQLAGNFDVVTDVRVQSVDTRLSVPSGQTLSTPAPDGSTQTSNPPVNTTPVVARPSWILPVLFASILLMIILIGGVVYVNWHKQHVKKD